jgi:hypothetical protein
MWRIILGIFVGVAGGAAGIYVQQIYAGKTREIVRLRQELVSLRKRNDNLRAQAIVSKTGGLQE